LLFKSKNKPEILIQISQDKTKLGKNTLEVQTQLQNILFLVLNGSIYPVLHDYVEMSLTIPLKKGTNEIEFIAIGLFKKRKQRIQVNSQGIVTLSELNLPEQNLIKTPTIVDSQPKITALAEPLMIVADFVKLSDNANIRLKSPILKDQEMLINYDINDLEFELNKSYNYE
jgi:hypothetical protein